MTMTTTPPRLTVGIDTHAEVHVAALLDEIGGLIDVESFGTTAPAYRELLTWARHHGTVDRVGIEGTGSWGAGLSRFLRSQDVTVFEVIRPNRQLRRRRGKDDTIDAIAAARAVLAGEACGPTKDRDGAMEAMRVLKVVRRSAIKERTAAINQLHDLIATGPEDLRDQLRGLTVKRLVVTVAAMRPGSTIDVLATMKLALRSLARRITTLEADIAEFDTRLSELVTAVAPALLDAHGVGVDTASTLLTTAGDNPDRLRNEASWARLCAAAPIPASSGARHRHRLNRGGDRQANAALWRIALVRMRSHPPTRAYVARRTTEGLSKREIMRCLKRYIARELYHQLPRPTT